MKDEITFKTDGTQNDAAITCLNCNSILIKGKGAMIMFGVGTSIACNKCGNKHTFGEDMVLSSMENAEGKGNGRS